MTQQHEDDFPVPGMLRSVDAPGQLRPAAPLADTTPDLTGTNRSPGSPPAPAASRPLYDSVWPAFDAPASPATTLRDQPVSATPPWSQPYRPASGYHPLSQSAPRRRPLGMRDRCAIVAAGVVGVGTLFILFSQSLVKSGNAVFDIHGYVTAGFALLLIAGTLEVSEGMDKGSTRTKRWFFGITLFILAVILILFAPTVLGAASHTGTVTPIPKTH